MTLSAAQLADYRRDGFLALEGFVPEATCDRLRARMDELLAGFDAEGVRTVFATDDQRHAQDDWFLDSGDQIRFFFEPGAFDARAGCASPRSSRSTRSGMRCTTSIPCSRAFSRDPSLGEAGARARPRRAAAAAVDVHLQAAAHRWRGGLPPGQQLPAHRSAQLRRPLARPRGRDRDQRLHVGRAGRASAAAAPAIRPGRPPDPDGDPRSRTAAERRAGAAAGAPRVR